jgi:hypothetical protein
MQQKLLDFPANVNIVKNAAQRHCKIGILQAADSQMPGGSH